ncbi:MAG: AtpZ/AtpI family protein [Selenomonadales bacterium]|nr:AtpZ/AtpI family protein [Selenomonadales bacterium]
MRQSDRRSLASAFAIAAGLGIESAVMIAVGVGLGRGADYLVGTEPVGTVIGIFVGVICAMRVVYRRVIRLK